MTKGCLGHGRYSYCLSLLILFLHLFVFSVPRTVPSTDICGSIPPTIQSFFFCCHFSFSRSHIPRALLDHTDLTSDRNNRHYYILSDTIMTENSHSCEIKVTFSTNLQATQAMQILQVDREPTNRVSKSFRIEEDDSLNKVSLVVYVYTFFESQS